MTAQSYGAIPFQMIREMIDAEYIQGASLLAIQPASLDLTITEEVYRMRGSYLPRANEPIRHLVEIGTLFSHPIDRPLEKDGIYLIRLKEVLRLPPNVRAAASNKSSSGRINLRGRLLADGVPRFDDIPAGYHGSLWLEVSPKSFPVLLHPGDRINQLRLFHGEARLSELEHRMAFDRFGLLRTSSGTRIPSTVENIGNGITMTIDLTSSETIGWRAKLTSLNLLDTARTDHEPTDFFEPVPRPKNGELVIHPQSFFILATKEKVVTPPSMAMEMAAYDTSKGEFRSHFAGFFDPGFGWRENEAERGAVAVLEVEAYSHDFVLRDGQPICQMVCERVLDTPTHLYGENLKSNYTDQYGVRLAKWFKA
ncbi:MAG TPA: 2'-deoxycytidine 5'-triphosphate deaminase [Patescibacteria group bacterium]|nr:2'-deoxycytidine 5'-triphosphate deaminase [Patescibacteria group bacterium]